MSSMKIALKNILLAATASNQDEICHLLESQGFVVNQSKISRLLRELGAMKVQMEDGHLVYCIPKEPIPLSPASSLSNLIISVEANECMIVIRTPPGAAQLIARLLDYNHEKTHILGTVAGDDTIFITPKTITEIEAAIQEVKSLLYGG